MKFPSQISIQRTCSDLVPYKSLPLPAGWETTDMAGTNLYLHRSSGTITAKDPRKPAPVPLRRRVVSFFERHAVKMKVTMTIKRQRTTNLPAYSTTYPYSIMMRVLTPKKSDPSAARLAASSLQIKRYSLSKRTQRDLRVDRTIRPRSIRVAPSPELVRWYRRSSLFVAKAHSEKGLVSVPEMEVVRTFTPVILK